MHGRGGVRRPARTRGAPGRALRGWPSQRGRRRDDGGRDRLGSHRLGRMSRLLLSGRRLSGWRCYTDLSKYRSARLE